MEVLPLRSRLVRPGDSLLEAIDAALQRARITPRDGDIIVVSSKVVSLTGGNLRDVTRVKPSIRASKLAKKYSMDPRFTQIVIDEADRLYLGVRGAILTLKDGVAIANSGADQKNSLKDHVTLWPPDIEESGRRLRRRLEKRYGRRLGVLIVDSSLTPSRMGTVGLALASAGFRPVENLRGQLDIYGRQLRITRHAVADDIASAAHLVMGESNERVPFVLIRNSPAMVDGRNRPRREMLLPPSDCLYMSNIS